MGFVYRVLCILKALKVIFLKPLIFWRKKEEEIFPFFRDAPENFTIGYVQSSL